MKSLLVMVALSVAAFASSSYAVTVGLNKVDSFAKGGTGVFGLAWDGSHVWYSGIDGNFYQMTTNGVNTGVSGVLPVQTLTALAWDGSYLNMVNGNTIYRFDSVGSHGSFNVGAGVVTNWPHDGLDYEGGNYWFSPDLGPIEKLDSAGNLLSTIPGPHLYSGVEQVLSYLIAVRFPEGGEPHKILRLMELDGTLIGEADFLNDWYEDMAFDGRYLYVADYQADRIDKFEVLVDDVPLGVPEPSTFLLLASGLVGLVGGRGLLRYASGKARA